MHPCQAALSLAAAAVLAGPSAAQMMPIAPFTGTQSEGFETQNYSGASMCITDRVFSNTADFCTPGGDHVLLSSAWSFSCLLQEHSGSRFVGSAGGPVEITFDTPITRFGGYFATNSGTPDATANFYDDQDVLISSEVISYSGDCLWNWNGWQVPSSTTVGRIEIIGNHGSGGFVHMDDLEADQAPISFSGTPDQISLTNGGTQSFLLDAGPTFAGLPYAILGSTSGTTPGILIDGLLLPLNADTYLLDVLINPNLPPLSNSVGALDAQGMATASFTVPPGLPLTLIGLQFHHAFLVIELLPTLLHVVFVSEAVPVVLTL